MKEATGNLWTYKPCDARIITTNGDVVGRGDVRHAVMGRGVALQALKRYPGLDAYLGMKIDQSGNVPMAIMNFYGQWTLVTMPVKNHWRSKADLALIQRSARLLADLASEEGFEHVVMPRPGCGAGERDWESEVRPILVDLLDDRFTVVFRA